MAEKLKGKYGFSVAFSMVVGIVIGIGIFLSIPGRWSLIPNAR